MTQEASGQEPELTQPYVGFCLGSSNSVPNLLPTQRCYANKYLLLMARPSWADKISLSCVVSRHLAFSIAHDLCNLTF